MKWTVVFFGFAICLAGSLVTLCILVLAGVSVGWWWLIPAGCVCLLGVSGSRMVCEQMAAVRNAFRDFLENGVALRPVDSADFPPEYVEKIVQAADELVAAGMICEGDFQGPEERMALEKKKFRRILRSSDGTLWAEVAAMRPKFPARCLMYLFGYGRYCRRASVEISSFFADCSMMDVVNGKKIAGMREIPGLQWIHSDYEEPRAIAEVTFDPVTAAQLGVTRTMTAANLALAAGDVAVGAVWEGDYKVPVVLKNEDCDGERSLSDVADTYVSSLVPGVSAPPPAPDRLGRTPLERVEDCPP